MSHLSPEVAGDYAANLLEANERAAVEAHVDGCADCRELVSAIARAMFASLGAGPTGAPEPDGGAVLPRGTKVGHFVLEQPLGAGGMGLVYLAYDGRLDRQVALKCLRERAGEKQQLLDEARLMAQLAHPNVVPVYDVIESEGQTFIAMELVPGRTLRQWLDGAERSWHDVVDRFLEAGEGLAAAHAAGIVHGDVKPGNVLIGRDGRARVTDFGLASLGRGEGGGRGTPAYLSPEQRQGAPCDTKGDQYAFAVSLHEALTGAFPGQQPTRRARVPGAVRRVLTRALATSPAERFDSMTLLLATLRRARLARWRFVAAAVTAAVVFAFFSFGAGGRRATTAQCEAAAKTLTRPWTAELEQRSKESFARTKLSYAAETHDRVRAALGGWQRRFDETRETVCSAGLFATGPSPALVRQLTCLEEAAIDARALVTQLLDADTAVVLHAVAAAEQLPSPRACVEVAQPLEVFEMSDAARQVQEKIAATRALAAAGRYPQALEVAKETRALAEQAHDSRLEAWALTLLGGMQGLMSEHDAAEQNLREAIRLADLMQEDRSRCFAWADLLTLQYSRGRHDDVIALSGFARGACERIDDVRLTTDVMASVGTSLAEKGNFASGERVLREAVERREAAFGPKDRRTAATLSELANVLAMKGDLKAAIDAHQRALAAAVEAFGPSHPETAVIHQNLGDDFLYGLEGEAAVREISIAVEVFAAANGASSRTVAIALTDLAFAHLVVGRRELALETAEKALAIFTASFPKHPVRGMALLARHQARAALGQPTDVADLEQALDFADDLPPFEKGRLELELATQVKDPARARKLVADALTDLSTTTLPLIAREKARAEGLPR